jgi:hypothetical protein
MKRLIVIASGLILLTNIFAQDDGYGINNTTYGVNVYRSLTSSGYGPSINLNINAQKFNRVFELGIMLDTKHKNINGAEFLYKHFFGFHLANFYKKPIKPYIYYNFLYRAPTEVIVDPSTSNDNATDTGDKITTFEHAIGLGSKFMLLKKFYTEGNIGFGVYLGSHYQNAPKTWGVHLHNYGFVPSFKVGFGYQF